MESADGGEALYGLQPDGLQPGRSRLLSRPLGYLAQFQRSKEEREVAEQVAVAAGEAVPPPTRPCAADFAPSTCALLDAGEFAFIAALQLQASWRVAGGWLGELRVPRVRVVPAGACLQWRLLRGPPGKVCWCPCTTAAASTRRAPTAYLYTTV
jgi:hypothetical protein